MRPTLITLIAAAVGVFGTLVFRDLLLAWFAGQSSNSLFAPWVLIEGVFVFVIALSLFFFVARCTKSHSSLLLLVAAIAYILGTLPTSVWFSPQPIPQISVFATYLAAFLPQLASCLALLIAFYFKTHAAKR